MQPRKAVVAAAVTLAIAGGAYPLYRYSARPAAAPRATEASLSEPNVLRYPAGSPQLQYLSIQPVILLPEPLLEPLSGRVAYDENYTSRVAAPVAGRVVKIEVQPGDSVKAGEALAWLDAPEYATSVADVQKSESEVRLKTRSYERAKELLEADVLARKDYEAAESDLKQAEAELHRSQLKLRNLNLGSASARDDGRFAVRAPIAGVVADRQVNPGGEVRPDAQAPLFVITDPSHVWVIIDLPERYLGKVRVGQVVSVEVDAYKGIDISGRIASIGQVLDPATRRVQIRCVVANEEQLLKPEMFARVAPLSEERQKLARIPNSALVSEGLYSFVFVETAAGVFERRRVTLGLQGRDESYVRTGLSAGEKVVAAGALLLQSELASRR
jgi:cobalt-zinc-cadmium efflux system membrane fusion protein